MKAVTLSLRQHQPEDGPLDVDDVRRVRGGDGQLPRQRGGEARRAGGGNCGEGQLRLHDRVQLRLRGPFGHIDQQVQEPHSDRRPPRGGVPRAGAHDPQQRGAAAAAPSRPADPLPGGRRLERRGGALSARADGERHRDPGA